MSRFATAVDLVPEPCSVMGTVLRPFCLGHHLLFRKFGLPFADAPEATASRDEILTGIAVCGQSYSETMEAILSGSWARQFNAWLRDVRGPWYRRRLVSITGSEKMFRRYLQDGYQRPPIWRRSGGGIDLSAPWEQLLKVRLVRSGLSELEVLEGYLPARWYDFFTVRELDQLEHCTDEKKWKKVFFTAEDRKAMSGS